MSSGIVRLMEAFEKMMKEINNVFVEKEIKAFVL